LRPIWAALPTALLLLGPRLVTAEDAGPTQVQVESALTCQCGCGLTVHSCNHLNCGSGIPLKNEIAEQIATGASHDEILGYFERKYGEKILSAPTTRGFNLAAWVVPFLAIGIGGLLVARVLRRWRRTTVEHVSDAGASDPLHAGDTVDPALRARLDRELAELERRS
jgi:cytochrome c-type biogenesis protein CcmH